MEPKPGIKTTEFIALIVGLVVAVVPVVLDKIPPDSVWAVVLGGLLAVATYIGGRGYLKGVALKADAHKSTGGNLPSNPS
jgi:hypothetical protein